MSRRTRRSGPIQCLRSGRAHRSEAGPIHPTAQCSDDWPVPTTLAVRSGLGRSSCGRRGWHGVSEADGWAGAVGSSPRSGAVRLGRPNVPESRARPRMGCSFARVAAELPGDSPHEPEISAQPRAVACQQGPLYSRRSEALRSQRTSGNCPTIHPWRSADAVLPCTLAARMVTGS